MRYSELWARLERHLGAGYASVWADQHVMSGLGERTVREALDAGATPREVWSAVWERLELPASER